MSSAARTAAAGEEDMANKTENLSNIMGIGSFLSGAIKGVSAIASIGTGGFNIGGLLMGGGSPSGYGK